MINRYLLPAIVIALLCPLPAAMGQQDDDTLTAQPVAAPSISLGEIESLLSGIDESTTLSAEEKEELAKSYRSAQQLLQEAESRASQIEELQASIESAPAAMESLKARLDAPPAEPPTAPPDDAPLETWQAFLNEQEQALRDARQRLIDQETERQRRVARRLEAQHASTLSADLTEAQEALAAFTLGENPTDAQRARHVSLLARIAALESEQQLYDAEMRAFNATSGLLPLQRDLAVRNVVRLEQRVEAIRNQVTRQRQVAWNTRLRATQEALAAAPSPLQPLAKENQKLAEDGQALAEELHRLSQLLASRDQELLELNQRVTRVTGKVDSIGRTQSVGMLLRYERDTLPDYRQLADHLRSRQRQINQALLQMLELEERRSDLSDLQGETVALLAQLPVSAASEGENLEPAARELLHTQSDLLVALVDVKRQYSNTLFDLYSRESSLIQKTEEFTNYIDERIFWVRSAPPFGFGELRDSLPAAREILRPQRWRGVAASLGHDIRSNAALWIFAIIVFAGLLAMGLPLRKRIGELGLRSQRGSCAVFAPTAQALLWTVLIALPFPAVVYFIASRLRGIAAEPFNLQLATTLGRIAVVWFFMELARQVLRPRGLGESHFLWPESTVRALHRSLAWFMPLMLLVIAAGRLVRETGELEWEASLGRLIFLVALFVLGLWIHRLLHPRHGALQLIISNSAGGWRNSRRVACYLAGILVPVAIGILTILGYSFTAEQLAKKVWDSLGLLSLIFLAYSLLLRSVLVNHRRTAIEEARRPREPAFSESSIVRRTPDSQPNAGEIDPQELGRLSNQARRTARALALLAVVICLWITWAGVVPALAVLDQLTLWDQTSLSDLLIATLLLVIASVAAMNLPGMLEIGVLQRLSIDPGLRYAISTITRYTLAIVGVVVALNWLGFGWNRLQWLVAALGVGLGFGLQEIVANFVSGLILLFERPLRVGDIISIGDVSGQVTKIRIRATTICGWDRKELIVPNKDFITQRLLNWTLTDEVNRIEITVGAAYGSDIRLVHDLLLDVCRENNTVLTDPAPLATLEEFGDNSLNFVIRAYLPDLQNRLNTIHALHEAIQTKFNEHGLEIAFPQRDIHIRSDDTRPPQLPSEKLPINPSQGDARS